MNPRVSFNLTKYSFKESLRFSFIGTAIFCFIFIVAKILGIEKNVDVHYLNYVLIFFVAYVVTRKVFDKNNHDIEYYTCFMIGVTTITFASFWYSILFFIYLHFDPQLMMHLQNTIIPHAIIAPQLSIAMMLFSEGFGLSVIISLALTEFFKWRQTVWGFRPKDTS